MKILIVSQYFWPENFRINDLAVGLLERGHTVTVLTGAPNYPAGKFFPGYGLVNSQEDYHGVTVLRVPLFPRGSGSGLHLALNFISFAVSAGIFGPLLCKGTFERIFVYEPSPITVGIPALILGRIKSAPVLFWVQDLWPESLSATGAITSRTVLGLVERFVAFLYRRCDLILIQSRAFFDSIVQRGGSPQRIRYFPNSAESVYSVPAPSSIVVPSLPDGFKVMFAGNIGAAQDFETVIAAAEILKGHEAIQWIIVGDGRMREWAEAQVETRKLGNTFHFIGRHPLETMPALFACADALLVTLKKEPVFALTIPSKIQAYLACARPVIAALDGEGARIIAEAGAGFTCPAEAPAALAKAVLKMSAMPRDEREQLGMSGRRYYEANFDREVLLDKLDFWMKERIVDSGS